MARPKQYASSADKQAAYRSRVDATRVVVDRVALDNLHERLERLQGAIGCAARNGVPFATRCYAASIETMLDKLVVAFTEEASPRAGGTDTT